MRAPTGDDGNRAVTLAIERTWERRSATSSRPRGYEACGAPLFPVRASGAGQSQRLYGIDVSPDEMLRFTAEAQTVGEIVSSLGYGIPRVRPRLGRKTELLLHVPEQQRFHHIERQPCSLGRQRGLRAVPHGLVSRRVEELVSLPGQRSHVPQYDGRFRVLDPSRGYKLRVAEKPM